MFCVYATCSRNQTLLAPPDRCVLICTCQVNFSTVGRDNCTIEELLVASQIIVKWRPSQVDGFSGSRRLSFFFRSRCTVSESSRYIHSCSTVVYLAHWSEHQ